MCNENLPGRFFEPLLAVWALPKWLKRLKKTDLTASLRNLVLMFWILLHGIHDASISEKYCKIKCKCKQSAALGEKQ